MNRRGFYHANHAANDCHPCDLGNVLTSSNIPFKNPANTCCHPRLRSTPRVDGQRCMHGISGVATHTHTHTHTFNGPFSGTTRMSRYQKGKTNLDFTGARDSEWQWYQLGHMQVCTSLLTDNHASTTPLVFTGRMPFLPPNQQRQSTEGKNRRRKRKNWLTHVQMETLVKTEVDGALPNC